MLIHYNQMVISELQKREEGKKKLSLDPNSKVTGDKLNLAQSDRCLL